MPTLQDVEGWKGRTVVDPDGDKVGTLEEFYLDRQSGDPTWAAIRTGLFGTHTSLAPLDGASLIGNEVRLGYSKAAVKDAPRPEVEGELTRDEERRLFDHYGAAKAAAQPAPASEPTPEAAQPTPEPAQPGPERPAAETQTVTPQPEPEAEPQREEEAPAAAEAAEPEPSPQTTPSIAPAPEPAEPQPVPTAAEARPAPTPAPAPAPAPAPSSAPAVPDRQREAALERFQEGWLIDGTLVQPRRARLRRYIITEELILEPDGTESSRIVGKEPYPDPPQD